MLSLKKMSFVVFLLRSVSFGGVAGHVFVFLFIYPKGGLRFLFVLLDYFCMEVICVTACWMAGKGMTKKDGGRVCLRPGL